MGLNLLHKKLIFLFLAFAGFSAQAQQKEESLKSLLETRDFVFKVQSVSPASMPTRQLTGDNYNIRISGDTLVSFLPYFGRAFSVPAPGAPGGYNFTSTDFEYQAKARRKGGREVIIRPKDINDVREFSLTISESGYASLRAVSNNRQLISYNGFVTHDNN